MAGVLPLEVRMLPRLKSLGYREVTLEAAGLLGPPGTRARGHEFHYSEITSAGRAWATTGSHRRGEGTAGKDIAGAIPWPATCTCISAATRPWPAILSQAAGRITEGNKSISFPPPHPLPAD